MHRMHRKHLKHPETMDRGQKKLHIVHALLSTASEPKSVCSSTSPSWWKKYFGCFSRRRVHDDSGNNTGTTFIGGKYKRLKNKTKRNKTRRNKKSVRT